MFSSCMLCKPLSLPVSSPSPPEQPLDNLYASPAVYAKYSFVYCICLELTLYAMYSLVYCVNLNWTCTIIILLCTVLVYDQ